jgi:threonyl-tRNA synthetase
MSESRWLTRILFLETLAGVPGMVAAMLRHFRSLRDMRRDHGWIHTLLEEAENERMHLLVFLQLRQPGPLMRLAVLGAQGVFFNAFFLAYLLSPRACHAFVGYLEEEAVRTYTAALAQLDRGQLPAWAAMPASLLARRYWHLADGATMRDVLLAVRADEAVHRDVNHAFAALAPDAPNPFATAGTPDPAEFAAGRSAAGGSAGKGEAGAGQEHA